jgi:ketosteroid isomerase-like protein
MGTAPSDPSLEAAFETLRAALKGGDVATFYGCMHDDFVMFDEDIPFRLDKQEFSRHIDFHIGGTWDAFEWYPRDRVCRVFGDTGIVAGYVTFRGKPKDAGFRQVHMSISQGWVRENGRWRLVLWHQSPLHGHVNSPSPS